MVAHLSLFSSVMIVGQHGYKCYSLGWAWHINPLKYRHLLRGHTKQKFYKFLKTTNLILLLVISTAYIQTLSNKLMIPLRVFICISLCYSISYYSHFNYMLARSNLQKPYCVVRPYYKCIELSQY